MANLMIERIDIVIDGLKIKWSEIGWQSLLGEFIPQTIGAELVAIEPGAIEVAQ